MSNVIQISEFMKLDQDKDENRFYSLHVFKDLENGGEVVSQIEHNKNIPIEVVREHLDQLSWKAANQYPDDKGQITLRISIYEHTSDFVENPDIRLTKRRIGDLEKDFENIIKALKDEGARRGEYE